jgi:hypothetical protein
MVLNPCPELVIEKLQPLLYHEKKKIERTEYKSLYPLLIERGKE